MVSNIPSVWLGLIGSTIAGLGTGLGALPIFLVNRISPNSQGVMLGFGAGVMLAATAFSLVIPGLDAVTEQGGGNVAAAFLVSLGIMLGGVFLWLSHRYFPHEHFFKGREGQHTARLKQVWLFIMAIAIHNFPEGLAVGVGFGGDDIGNAVSLAAGIGLQNMPEGLVVALSLRAEKYSKRDAFLISLVTGLVEPIGGVLGSVAVSLFRPILPIAMGFAAGAMLFVISDEIIPESHRLGYEKAATAGVMVGFVLMMILDVTIG
ncbi:ZIP family metal transporter [Leptolyngbya sp. AN02str]|uniref:ZIP family metal transporter n=1 Tax=Leptolyngbya sp. AN02str TaxID=3423363 RepID=UPI003D31DBE2